MKLVETKSRKDLIQIYLQREEMDKQHRIPACPEPDWNDANAIYRWLGDHGYKQGVFSGFKEWALVELTKDDLLDCAIVNHIFTDCSHRTLRAIIGSCQDRVKAWKPCSSKVWYEPLDSGAEFRREWALILRSATPDEAKSGAKWYLEDGSGRSLCYARRLCMHGEERKALGYLGYKPDPTSAWLLRELNNGHFVKNRAQYQEPCLR